jgi:hypothetical protein
MSNPPSRLAGALAGHYRIEAFNAANFLDQNYSFALDRKTFIMLQRVVGAEQALVVTLNWFDQFRTRK